MQVTILQIQIVICAYSGSSVKDYLFFIFFADRYVLLGNHRDAWGLGSVDPSSGSASLIEITRVFGKMKMQGEVLDLNVLIEEFSHVNRGRLSSVAIPNRGY